MKKLKGVVIITHYGISTEMPIIIPIEDTPPESHEMLRELFNARLAYFQGTKKINNVKDLRHKCLDEHPKTKSAVERMEEAFETLSEISEERRLTIVN